jgi:hypothetical protein
MTFFDEVQGVLHNNNNNHGPLLKRTYLELCMGDYNNSYILLHLKQDFVPVFRVDWRNMEWSQ